MLLPEQRLETPRFRRKSYQGFNTRPLLYQRRVMDDFLCASAAIAGAGDRGGTSVRSHTDNPGL